MLPHLAHKKESMASLKARLTVALRANDVVVAELEDPQLWQRVLASINVGDSAFPRLELPIGRKSGPPGAGK